MALSLQYISVPEWLYHCHTLACQNGSLHCHTLACRNGSLHCRTLSVPERMAFTSVPEWLAYQNGSITGRTLASQNGIFTAIYHCSSVPEWLLFEVCALGGARNFLAARGLSHLGTGALTGLSWSVPRVCTNVVVAWCAFTLCSR